MEGRPCDADFGPQAGEDDVLASGGFYGLAEFREVPGVHTRALDWCVVGKDVEKLGPHVSAEAFGFDGSENDGDVEEFCAFGEHEDIVDKDLALDVANAEDHLWLKVDEGNGAIIFCEQAAIGFRSYVSHFSTSYEKGFPKTYSRR